MEFNLLTWPGWPCYGQANGQGKFTQLSDFIDMSRMARVNLNKIVFQIKYMLWPGWPCYGQANGQAKLSDFIDMSRVARVKPKFFLY